MPLQTPFVSIRDFGAVPDDPSPPARLLNTESFRRAQAAMKSDPNAFGHPLFVPSGTFFLSDDLHVAKSLELFGTGARGESILRFPPGKSLVIDPGNGVDPELDGSNCLVRDLQITSEEGWTADEGSPFDPDSFDPPVFEGRSKGTPGVRMQATAILQRLYLHGFSGSGIYVKKTGATNVNQWRIHDVYVESCGGHGIHVGGDDDSSVGGGRSETQGGLCTGALIIGVGGSGVFENSFGGNTYVGCYVEVAKGRGYASTSPGQVSFIGCFAEANERVRLSVGGGVWIGGGAGAGFTDDTLAFIAESFADVHPFTVRNQRDLRIHRSNPIQLHVGYPSDASDPTSILAWESHDGAGFYLLRWDDDHKAWTVENGSVVPVQDPATGEFRLRELSARNVSYYLTGSGHPRDPWKLGAGEILLGPVDKPIRISHGNGAAPPADGSGEPGDIFYHQNPEVGDYVGLVCTAPNRVWKPFGRIEEPRP